MPKVNSRSTNAESWSKAILKSLAWISMRPLLLSSELNQSELSSLLQLPTIFTSYTSTAKMPSCMAKATSRSMSHNQKALWMNGFLQKFSISTSLSMVLNKLLVSGIFCFVEWYQNSGLWHWKRIPAFMFEGTSFSQSVSTIFKWLVQQKKTVMQYIKNWRSTSKSSIKALSGASWASILSGIGMTISSPLIRAHTSIVFLENLDLQTPNRQAHLSIHLYRYWQQCLATKCAISNTIRDLLARSIISLFSHAPISPSLSPNYLSSTQIQPHRISKRRCMFYVISKALAICASSTNGNLAPSSLLDTPMPIGDQTRMTEYLTLGTPSKSMVDLPLGLLTNNLRFPIQQCNQNIWRFPTPQGKPSPEHNSFKNSTFPQCQFLSSLTAK